MENAFSAKWSAEIETYGFTAVPNLLIEYRHCLNITVNEFYVLLAIEKHRWDTLQLPWPSNKELGRLTGFSERTIIRLTASLERKGLLKKIYRIGMSNLYDLTPLIEELQIIASPQCHTRLDTGDYTP